MGTVDRPPVSGFPAYNPKSNYGLEPARDYSGCTNEAYEQDCLDIANRAAQKQQRAEHSITKSIIRLFKSCFSK